MSQAAQHLRSLLAPVVGSHGLYLEDVRVRPVGKRRVVAVTVDLPDGPGGVDSDLLADVSRAVSATLDDDATVPGPYLLEVSTPGTDRPLREPRHFRRALGRLARLRLRSGERLSGRIVAADDAGLVVLADDAAAAARRLGFEEITEGTVEVELRAAAEDGEV